MANNLFISYDLHPPGQNYNAVIAEIKTLGPWAKIHYSLFYVKSELSSRQALARVWAVMDPNDRLIVIDTTNNMAAWQNLPADVEGHLMERWRE